MPLWPIVFEARQEDISENADRKLNSATSMLEQGSNLSRSLMSHLRDSDQDFTTEMSSDVMDRVAMLVKDELMKLNCRLILEGDSWPIICKPTSLDQVLVNLIINGAHACYETDETGVVKVSISQEEESDFVQIRVTDNGVGIANENINKLFAPLFSTKGVYATKSSKASNLKGTGLGLHLARQLVSEQKGDLRLESTSSSGTTFLIKIPLGEVADLVINNGDQLPEKVDDKKFKIYVADDAKENRAILKVYLKDKALSFMEAENGEINEEEILKFNPDIIFVDWLMPRFNGNDFLSYMASNEKISHLMERVVILSGLDLSDEISRWSSKVRAVAKKPISQTKLIGLLEGLNVKRHYLS